MNIFKQLFKSVDEGAGKLRRDEVVQKWLDEISEAEKREKGWRKEAQRVVELYEQQASADDSAAKATFNILYANTETLAPAVYNNVPRPVVKRKVDKDNPVAIAAAQVLKHTLVYLTDTGSQAEMTFDDLQKTAVLEALVPGRGAVRFSFDDEAGEYVCGDAVPWNRFVHGYAKQYHGIPWKAYEHFMTREECVSNFGEEKGGKIKLTHVPSDDKDKAGDGENEAAGPADAAGTKFAHIWEIWDKRTKKVLFVSEGSPQVVDERDDPLQLEGFFPDPRPIFFLQRVSSLTPQTLYLFYEEQAKELEDVTRRIGHITRAMKIRGFYDGTLQGLDQLLTKPENTLMPAENVAAMQQGQTLEKAIWFMPLEQLVGVLQQLYLNRTQIIGVIHQLTGIADIMRGSSQASETLGAQKMKEAWGTMRLKRMQKEVQRFTRDCYRLQAEIAAKHLSIETFIQMTGLKFPRAQDKQIAQAQMQQLQIQAEELQALAQGGQAPPEQLQQMAQQLDQQAQQVQSVLAPPSWEEILEFLRSDTIRNFAIDIETNSTIDIEATEDKQELAEMMNSMAQLFNGVFPMVKEGVFPFDAAKALTLSVVQKFRLGDDVEEYFKAMQQPPQQEDPAAAKVQAEMKRDEAKFGMEQKAKQDELAQKQQLAQAELAIKQKELEFAERELAMKMEFAQAKHKLDMEMLTAKAVLPPAAPQPSPQGASNADV